MATKQKADLFIQGASEVITCVANGEDQLGRINQGAVAIKGDQILAVGRQEELQETIDLSQAEVRSAAGMIVAPGFVDCHTHLIFGRSRAQEFALKMTKSVAEIEAMGIETGIPASIRMTREEDEDALYRSALDRLQRMLRYGTTTLESKSGYGIRQEDEIKQLMVNRRLVESQPVEIVSTFLGAHDFPPEIDRDDPKQRNAYIGKLTNRWFTRYCRRTWGTSIFLRVILLHSWHKTHSS